MSCNCLRASVSKRKEADEREDIHDLLENVRHLSYNELRSATNCFDLSNKIGRGGFGTVFKGTLGNGTQVAVKTLSVESKQGLHEFLTELQTISNVRHPNLVEIIGCCVERNNRILVYEFVENNSLDRMLLGSKRDRVKLDWEKRSAICIGTARGLAFLHEELAPHIVHRDIKASNILLDRDFMPKIGDFGLAKLFPDDITHISTRIAGTTGYLAPEYALGGQLTLKADVYSFGVLVLEILSGKSNARSSWGGMQKMLVEWAWQLHIEGDLLDMVDPEMEEFPKEEAVRYMKVAFFCTQAAANQRPMMSQVIQMLTRTFHLNDQNLTAPGFFQDYSKSVESTAISSDKRSCSSSNSVAVTLTDVNPR